MLTVTATVACEFCAAMPSCPFGPRDSGRIASAPRSPINPNEEPIPKNVGLETIPPSANGATLPDNPLNASPSQEVAPETRLCAPLFSATRDSDVPIVASVSLNDRPLAIALAKVRASDRETLSDETVIPSSA
jgi:hypothetical protein